MGQVVNILPNHEPLLILPVGYKDREILGWPYYPMM
jgi:hypothetical protein